MTDTPIGIFVQANIVLHNIFVVRLYYTAVIMLIFNYNIELIDILLSSYLSRNHFFHFFLSPDFPELWRNMMSIHLITEVKQQ